MVDGGPTEVGSIVAKLKIDDSDWNAKLTAAEARARALGAVDPEIKVTSDVDQALAGIAAVDAAAASLEKSTKIDWFGFTPTAAKSIDNLSKSVASVDDAVKKAGDGQRGYMAHWQVIALVIAGLIPLMAPLAGYIVGVAGAMVGMGAAGVLAILGIKNAMDDGSATGREYAAGLSELKGMLDDLSATAAAGMIGQFRVAVAQLTIAMPFLNTQVSLFTRQLGTAGNYVLQGVITSLRVLNPLFLTAGAHIEKVAAGFAAWAGNGGLREFSDYALRALPQVADTVGLLALAILHIVEATAPLGTAALGALTLVAGAINALPLDVLLTLGTLAVGAVIGFKAWAIIGPLIGAVATQIGAVGLASNLALGPVGWVAAAIGALGAIIAVIVGQTTAAADAMSNYTAAVQQDSGVIATNTREAAANALQKEGAYDLAKKLGVSLELVTDATLGEAGAQEELAAALAAATDGHSAAADAIAAARTGSTDYSQAAENLTDKIYTQSGAIQMTIDGYRQTEEGLGRTTESASEQADEIQRLAAGYGLLPSAYHNAIDSGSQTEAQLAETTAEMIIQNDAAGLLRSGLDLLNGGSLDLAAAETAQAAATNRVIDSLTDKGLAILGNTDAAIANQQAIQAKVSADQAEAEATAAATGSSEAATQAYMDAKTALEQQLSAQGLLTDEVQAYIDKLYDVGNLVIKPTKLDVDTAAAEQKIAQFIDGQSGRTIWLNVATSYAYDSGSVGGIPQVPGHADGGTVTGFGTARSDSNLRRLSAGEEVIQAGSAAKVRPLLKAINADPAAAVAAMMSGGGGQSGPAFTEAGPGLARLLRGIAALGDRPIIVQLGDETIASHASAGFNDVAARGSN